MNNVLGSDQQEIIVEFVQEIRELLDELELTVLDMETVCGTGAEQSPAFREKLNSIFRMFHSIKGSAGFLAFNHIVKVAHTAESLLDNLRNGQIVLQHNHTDLLCQSCDFVKAALEFVENNLNDSGMAEKALTLVGKFLADSNSSSNNAEKNIDTGSASEHAKSDKMPELSSFAINLDLPEDKLITAATLQQFLQEAEDILHETEEDLLSLSRNIHNREVFERLFRNIHSFKGNCGFLGLGDLEKLGRKTETILEAIRAGAGINIEQSAETLLKLQSITRETIDSLGMGKQGTVQGVHLYLELLDDLLPDGYKSTPNKPTQRIGDILIQDGIVTEEDVQQALSTQKKLVGELLIDSGAATEQDIARALEKQRGISPAKAEGPASGPVLPPKRQDIRVDLEKLDNLINLIGEMVIAENMIIHNPDLAGLELENFNKASQQMSKLIRELQEMAMTIRMIPVSGLFRRMMRLVHDLSRKSGKKVDLKLSGESTEVDKTVIEKITDPLVHLIRNSMDHGIESPEQRQKVNKPAGGVIELKATHEEGYVVISIIDDGQGLPRDKILAKAAEKGLIDADASQLTDKEIYNLIFLPGFSTADKVTDISGRGVGMDVVRRNLEEIKGKVEIQSTPGHGSTVKLRIPLTLAIIDGMLIRIGHARYIVPILSIRETFKPAPKNITVAPDGQEFVRIREHLLPVIRLHELHNITPDYEKLEDGILIVLESMESSVCLFADELMGQQQTVIKGLSNYLTSIGNVSGVSGCTILGNGEVCLILDVQSLIQFHEGKNHSN